jgi:ABC-2 type transport system ATP-binding protein
MAQVDVLLVDEVLAVGDADFQRKCYEYFRVLKAADTTIVFVTHDMNVVREFCDRVILVDEGKIKFEGDAIGATQAYLKSFEQGNGLVALGDNKKRWGMRNVFMESIKSVVNSRRIKIHIRVRVKRSTSGVIFGYIAKDSSGNPIMGTNNQLKGLENYNLVAGKSYDVNWDIPNVLSNGKYYFDIAITRVDSTEAQDWWEDAIGINIVKPEKTLYSVTPDTKLEIVKR